MARAGITYPENDFSGSARIITNLVINEDTVYLLSVYNKSSKDNLTDKELDELLQSSRVSHNRHYILPAIIKS